MPQLAGSLIGALGGPFGVAPAAVLNSVGIHVSGGLLGDLLGINPKGPKPPTTETPLKTSRPPRVSAYGISRLYGAYVLYETASDGTAVDVYAVHDGKMDSLEQWYLVDEKVELTSNTVDEGSDKRYKGAAVHLYNTDGSSPGTAFASLITLLPGIWTSAHRGDGVVMMALTAKAVKAKDFQETYPQSSVPVPSMVARWQLCPDPAADDPTDTGAWTWTENSVRHLMHYKMVREGVDYTSRIAPVIDYWIAAAADCDVAMDLKAGGAEARYRSCVSHTHTTAHKDVNNALLATFDGWIAPRSDGALVVYSGRYYEPTVSIGPDEIVSYNWDGVAVDDDSAVNEIVVSFVSAEHDYNVVEAGAWQDEADISARGKVLSQPLDADIPSQSQGRRLAKRTMLRVMATDRGTVTTNVAGRAARGERYIDLHIEEAGTVFYSGPAEITALTRNISSGGVTFSWVAADPDVDDWDAEAEEGDAVTVGEHPATDSLAQPVITDVSVIVGGNGTKLQIEATGDVRDDLTWLFRWRAEGETDWSPEQTFVDAGTGGVGTFVTDLVPAGEDLEFEVAYSSSDGRLSEWSEVGTISTGTIDGDVIYDGQFE